MDNKKTSIEIEKLDRIWDAHKDKVEEGDEGQFIAIDNPIIEREGISLQDMKAPGAFRGFSDNQGQERYFLRGFGHNRARLFKRHT